MPQYTTSQYSKRSISISFEGVQMIQMKQRSLLRSKAVTVCWLPPSRMDRQMRAIKDPSMFIKEDKKEAAIFRLLDAIDSRVPIIHPNSLALLCWNLVLVFFIILMFYLVLLIVLIAKEPQFISVLFSSILLTLICIDIFLIRFSICRYVDGVLVSSRREIFKSYSSRQLYLDLASAFSLALFLSLASFKSYFLLLLFYIRLLSIGELNSQITIRLHFRPLLYAVYRTIRLIVFTLTVWTIFAVIYFAIDYHFYQEQSYYFQSGQLWLTGTSIIGNVNIIEDFSWPSWFVYSIYVCAQIATTNGYGNFTPRNPPSTLFIVVVITVLIICQAYYSNCVWEIVSEYKAVQAKIDSVWEQSAPILQNSLVSEQLRRLIKTHFRDLDKSDFEDEENQNIENLLSKQLRFETILIKRASFWNGLSLLSKLKAHPLWGSAILKLAILIKEDKFSRDSILLEAYSSVDSMILVQKGKIGLFTRFDHSKFRIIQTGQFIACSHFMTNFFTFFEARALTYSKVSTLSRTDLLSVLRQIPSLYSAYRETVDELVQNNGIKLDKNDSCWICEMDDHQTQHCRTMFKPKLALVRQDKLCFSSYMDQQMRKDASRNRQKRCKSQVFVPWKTYSLSDLQSVNNNSDYRLNFNIGVKGFSQLTGNYQRGQFKN